MAARAWRATRAFAGRLKRWASPYEEGDLALFETGAIVLHIAEHHARLVPDDANARARAITWMFAALNTVDRRSSNS
jgi:hypothetical protein